MSPSGKHLHSGIPAHTTQIGSSNQGINKNIIRESMSLNHSGLKAKGN